MQESAKNNESAPPVQRPADERIICSDGLSAVAPLLD